jgi:hypothetical protein
MDYYHKGSNPTFDVSSIFGGGAFVVAAGRCFGYQLSHGFTLFNSEPSTEATGSNLPVSDSLGSQMWGGLLVSCPTMGAVSMFRKKCIEHYD